MYVFKKIKMCLHFPRCAYHMCKLQHFYVYFCVYACVSHFCVCILLMRVPVCLPVYEAHSEKMLLNSNYFEHKLNFADNFVQHYISMMIKEHQRASQLSEQTNYAGLQDLLKEY